MAKEELRIHAWMEQLRRMREMQYVYHKKFFHGLYFFLVVVIACLLWDSPLSLALVPFLVITAGTQSCFYLHFVDFARLHARHLEKKLNQALGKATLVGSKIEDAYFYPIDAPRSVGSSLPPLCAFSASSPYIGFCFGWAWPPFPFGVCFQPWAIAADPMWPSLPCGGA